MSIDHRLDDEQEQLRRTVEEFAREVVAPVANHHDETKTFPYDVVRQMADMGLFGLPFPEELGGMGGDYFALCLALEELARADSSVAITLEAGVSLGAMPVYKFGSPQQQQEWVPRLASGRELGAFGLTEPGGGSDAGAIRTRAKLADGHWTVDGSKAFITNSGTSITSLITTLCVTSEPVHDGDSRGRIELSSILIPVPAAGVTVAPGYNKVGWHASDTHELSYVGVVVPEENLLGLRGRGYANFLEILDEGRIAISALATGLSQGCVDECVRYANQREAFGVTIGRHQAVANLIADMQMRTHVSRTAWHDAASRMVHGEPFKQQAAIAKLYSSTAAVDNARDATQVFGGYGFMNDYPVARHWRDSKILEIGEGTNEVQRMLIARSLGL
jgi:short/branched chain acyl-CoA dehydrogenase